MTSWKVERLLWCSHFDIDILTFNFKKYEQNLNCLWWMWRRYNSVINSRQARSQDLEKGGLFWKSEKCANDLDSNFHWSWISFRRFVRKLRRKFSESWFFDRNPKFKGFFPPKIRWSPKKKKKRSSPKLRVIFRPKSEVQRFFPPKIRWSPKKKGLHRNWEWCFDRNPKFKGFSTQK